MMKLPEKLTYAFGSFCFSLIVVLIMGLFSFSEDLMWALSVFIIIAITFFGFLFPKIGKQLSKLFIGWSVASDSSGMQAAETAKILSDDKMEYFNQNFEVKPKVGLFIILVLIALMILMRF